MDIINHNKAAWDNYVDQQDRWTIPVSDEAIEKALQGEWNVILTPSKPVPHHWFPDLKGLKILGLASAGGQQGPVLASQGADVTIFDNSEKQLSQDKKVSDRFNLNIKTAQGDMKNLAVFPDNAFDLVFNPCSVLFVDDVKQVWKECCRVLKKGGILMTGLMNPLYFQLAKMQDQYVLAHPQPYSDLHSLTKEKLEEHLKANEPLTFGHSLADQLGGQLEAGFVITDLYEDDWGGADELDQFMPSYFATRAVKS